MFKFDCLDVDLCLLPMNSFRNWENNKKYLRDDDDINICPNELFFGPYSCFAPSYLFLQVHSQVSACSF